MRKVPYGGDTNGLDNPGGVPDFPATDSLTAVAVGIVSGLAATGINQAAKQLFGK